MTRSRSRLLLFTLLVVAAVFRLRGLDWDAGQHLHPDERFMSMVESRLADAGPLDYFRSATSTLNPYNAGYSSFVYGTLPMLLARYTGRAVGLAGYDGTYLAGRSLSALFDLLTLWLAYRIARRLLPRGGALIAVALLAGSPLAIQLSHFWAVDTFLTTFSTAALLAAVRLAQGRRDAGTLLLGGIAAGLATACKVTGIVTLAPLGFGLLIGSLPLPPHLPRWRRVARVAAAGLVMLMLAALTTRIALPYAFASGNPLSFRLDPRWVNDLRRLGELTSTVAAMPPSYQWAERTIAYPLWNLALYGCSPFFGLPALAALIWALTFLPRAHRDQRYAAWTLAAAPLLLHVAFLFGYHGFALVKAMRYFYPAYPALAVLSAMLLWRLAAGAATWGRVLTAICLGGTLLWGYAFSAIHGREHTRVWAARWIYANVQPPAIVLNETWDDALPLRMPGLDIAPYQGPQVEMVGVEQVAKIDAIVDALTKADVIAITSNRAYASLTRLPAVFPIARAYYRALFDGRLGFRVVADITSYPSLGPLRIPDDGTEEAFTVYDHPRVLIYRKTAEFSPQRVRELLTAALPSGATAAVPSIHEWARWPRGKRHAIEAVTPPRRHDAPGVSQEPPVRSGWSSIAAALWFYVAVAAIGAIAAPLAFVLFARFADRGLGFARLLGLIAVTFSSRVILWNGWLPNGWPLLWVALALLMAAAAIAGWRQRAALWRFAIERRRTLLVHEALFAAGFVIFAGLRALAPEIHWGEKPMDFSILNTLLRSERLPPADPWFSGGVFSYYYFGQETIAFLTRWTGIPARFTYNLAFGLLGGLVLQGAYALGGAWGRRWRAGASGAVLVLLIGNLAGPREWLVRGRSLDWDYFWATSRVVAGTINEYPLWSLLFADLHAHVLAIPLLLLVLAAALQLVRASDRSKASLDEWVRSAALLGFAAGLQALTNAWDAPLLIGLIIGVVPATLLLPSPPSLAATSSSRVAISTVIAMSTALLVSAPMWPRLAGSPGFGLSVGGAASGTDVLTVFGLFFYLSFAWCYARAMPRLPIRWRMAAAVTALSLGLIAIVAIDAILIAGILLFLIAARWLAATRDERLACALIATAFFLVLFPQHFYLGDRMNTFFKLYLSAWTLFAIAASVLIFGAGDSLAPDVAPAGGRTLLRGWTSGPMWTPGVRLAALILFVAAVFTGLTAAYGMTRKHRVAYSGPTLDGLRYLSVDRRGEYEAVQWIGRHITGTPVMLEAQGASYQDFSRISMLTGLPTVLGWEHHVKQRGHAPAEIEMRRDAVRAIYASADAAAIVPMLRRYHVTYIYDGWLERQTYPAEGLAKFSGAADLFELVYQNADTRIYRVRGAGGTAASR